MKRWLPKFWLLALVGLLIWAPAVSAAQPIKATFSEADGLYQSPAYKTKGAFSGVIAEWDGLDVHDPQIWLKADDSEWIPVLPDHDLENDHNGSQGSWSTLINFELSQGYQYRVNGDVSNLKFTFINVQAQKPLALSSSSVRLAGNEFSGFVPVISREQWGANDALNYMSSNQQGTSGGGNDEADREDYFGGNDPDITRVVTSENGEQLLWPYQYAKEIRYLVVHHTVSGDDALNCTPEKSKQMIRNIQYYHAVSRGWGDIGYNYLVDCKGLVYEGRKGGDMVIGGHSIPVNKTSVGIATIGNFQTNQPPKALLEGLVDILSVKAEQYNLDPLGQDAYNGKTYSVISGHRDTDSTACPGQYLHAMLPSVRYLVAVNTGDINPADSPVQDLEPLRELVELDPQSTKTITVKAQNNGTETWQKSGTYLALFDEVNTVTFPDAAPSYRVGQLQEASVAPNQVGTFQIKMASNLKSGYAPLHLTPTINNKVKRDNPIFVPVSVNKADFKYKMSNGNAFSFDLEPGQSEQINLEFENISDFTWNLNDDSRVRLGVDNPRDTNSRLVVERSGTGRVWTLDKKVTPGEKVKVTLTIKAPSTRGHIQEELRLVVDGFGWASGKAITLDLDNRENFTAQSNQTDQVGGTSGSRLAQVARRSLSTSQAPLPANGVDKEQIRVNLSYFDLEGTEVKLNSPYELFVDGKRKRILQTFDRSEVKLDGSRILVQIGSSAYAGNIVRFVPRNAKVGSFELVDYEQRPGWNQDLNDNKFRGAAEFRIDESKLIVINELALGYYLRGLAEVSNSAHPETIKTLIVIARSYAAWYLQPEHSKFKGKPYDLDDSPDRTQKYLGLGFELRSPNVIAEHPEVTNQIVKYNGEAVITPYFSRSGGRTFSAEEKWGWTDAPYLSSVPDTYCANADPATAAGHGVGLSGCGASGMAAAGKSYQEIIKYFYQGVDVEELESL